MSIKKHNQLGMNAGTASHRLVRDLLFDKIKDTPCYHCGGVLSRDNFSVEHKKPWLDSEDPLGLFFDISNISYSHLSCNCSQGIRNRLYKDAKERTKVQSQRWRDKTLTEEKQRRRREHYLKTGK
jgi:hypothetical protein